MAVTTGDVIFQRTGKPVQVTSKNPATGNVTIETDFDKIQEENKQGIKNGLAPEVREAYKTILSEVKNPSVKTEIDNLIKKISELKKEGSDPRLLRYLESELQFKMIRERETPSHYELDKLTLSSY